MAKFPKNNVGFFGGSVHFQSYVVVHPAQLVSQWVLIPVVGSPYYSKWSHQLTTMIPFDNSYVPFFQQV
jgi:hypothetical protein